MTDKEANDYADKREALLEPIEAEIYSMVERDIPAALASEKGLERLNDNLRDAIAATLFRHQRAMADLAVANYPGRAPKMISPTEILQSLEMAGSNFEEWFQRRSPSRWMLDVLNATPEHLQHVVKSAIASAVYGMQARQEGFGWSTPPGGWRWITRPELSKTGQSCGVCTPMNGKRARSRDQFELKIPVHPHCHCLLAPVN